jgi:hypothetical protein
MIGGNIAVLLVNGSGFHAFDYPIFSAGLHRGGFIREIRG